MKYIKEYNNKEYNNKKYYKISNDLSFELTKIAIWKMGANDDICDSLSILFKSYNYKYNILTINENEYGYMNYTLKDIKWLKNNQYIYSGEIKVTNDDIERYKINDDIKKYNL